MGQRIAYFPASIPYPHPFLEQQSIFISLVSTFHSAWLPMEKEKLSLLNRPVQHRFHGNLHQWCQFSIGTMVLHKEVFNSFGNHFISKVIHPKKPLPYQSASTKQAPR